MNLRASLGCLAVTALALGNTLGCFGAEAQTPPESGGTSTNSPTLPLSQTIEPDAEVVWASDILVTDSRLLYRQEKGGTLWDAAFSCASFDIDYQPFREFDFFGFPEHLHQDRFGGQVNLRQQLVDALTLLGSGGIYDGYQDYRRVWIANRYRQKYAHPDFPRVPGYKDPDPKGWNISAGGRWEYLPATGFAELKLGYALDQIAPGYEDSTNSTGGYLLLRGRERLYTKTLSFSSENVLTSRLRALNEFAFIGTSGRQLRLSYQGSLNLALSARWVVRGYGGVAQEAPRFDAYFFGTTVEWEAIHNLLLSLTGRYYKDTGEIESALLLSNAPPPLESWEAGLGLRYAWRRSSLKLYVAAFRTNYEAIHEGGPVEFTHLYSDRNWGLAQIAWSLQF